MSGSEPALRVENVDKEGSSPTTQGFEKEAFDSSKADKFQAALDKSGAAAGPIPNGVMDLAKEKAVPNSTAASLDTIQETSQAIQTRIQEIKEVLSSPGTRLKSSYQSLLENKLGHIDDALRIALEKTGAEEGVAVASDGPGLASGAEKFLGFLTRSQHRLDTVVNEIEEIRFNRGNEVRPADLLAVQVKVNFVQQELELFTNLLNKGLESTKTLLNVQV